MKLACLFVGLLATSTITFAQTLIANDDFSTAGTYFSATEKEDYTTKYEEGYFKINILKDGAFWFFNTFSDLNADDENYTVESTLELKGGSSSTLYGLVVGMFSDNSNYVSFLIDGDGQFLVNHHYSNENHLYAKKQVNAAIKKTGKNVLKVVRKFNVCEYYVNNILVHADANRVYHGSKFGFVVEGIGQVWADNFKVSKSPKTHNLIDNAIMGRTKIDLGTSVNSDYEELGPIISADGRTLYFTRNKSPENVGGGKQDIWYSTLLSDNTWGKAINIGFPLNNDGSNYIINITPDNNTIYVGNTYNSDGSAAHAGISVATRNMSGWNIPTELKIKDYKNVNQYSDYFPDFSNRFIIMAIENEESIGEKDLFISFRQDDGTYSKPVNMGNVINTPGAEFAPVLAADGKTLYFNSYGHDSYGSADVYITKRLDDSYTKWTTPKNLGPEINSDKWEGQICISADGRFGYLSTSNGVSNGLANIFRFELGSAAPEPVLLIYGKVLNSKTNEPLEANINYNDLLNNASMGMAISNPKDGSYKIVLPLGKDYSFLAEKNGFYPISDHIDVKSLKAYTEIERNLYLSPLEVGEKIRLNNLFFDTDKSDLKPASEAELNRLVKFMTTYPAMEIQISGYTDNVGSDDHNLTLSQSRVNSVVNYLTKKGISSSRLKGVGMGEQNPVASNDTEEGRAKNRRVEFTILKK